MCPVSLPSTTFSNRPFPTYVPLRTQAKTLCKPPIVKASRCNLPDMACVYSEFNHSSQVYFKKNVNSTEAGSLLTAFASKESGSGKENPTALETVLGLYTAIKNRNMNELSDTIGEECLCICNFVLRFQPFHGKKEVMEIFSSLMGNLGNNFELVVKPTWNDCWSFLESSNTHVPQGKVFSFYMCHNYQGKILIRNVEMFMEPLLHIEPLRLKMLGFVMNAMAQKASQARSKAERKRAAYISCCLLFIAALFLWSLRIQPHLEIHSIYGIILLPDLHGQ